jgi:HEPN domain-containing protein
MLTKEPATDAVAFHMQQCIEKYLKAFLTYFGKPFRKTH